jgi:hypothetical protein
LDASTEFRDRQRGAKQRTDVVGSVRKVVADAPDPTIVRHRAAAIAIDQSANEFFGGFFDEYFMPQLQPDRSQMLSTGPVLGERHGQCLE